MPSKLAGLEIEEELEIAIMDNSFKELYVNEIRKMEPEGKVKSRESFLLMMVSF